MDRARQQAASLGAAWASPCSPTCESPCHQQQRSPDSSLDYFEDLERGFDNLEAPRGNMYASPESSLDEYEQLERAYQDLEAPRNFYASPDREFEQLERQMEAEAAASARRSLIPQRTPDSGGRRCPVQQRSARGTVCPGSGIPTPVAGRRAAPPPPSRPFYFPSTASSSRSPQWPAMRRGFREEVRQYQPDPSFFDPERPNMGSRYIQVGPDVMELDRRSRPPMSVNEPIAEHPPRQRAARAAAPQTPYRPYRPADRRAPGAPKAPRQRHPPVVQPARSTGAIPRVAGVAPRVPMRSPATPSPRATSAPPPVDRRRKVCPASYGLQTLQAEAPPRVDLNRRLSPPAASPRTPHQGNVQWPQRPPGAPRRPAKTLRQQMQGQWQEHQQVLSQKAPCIPCTPKSEPKWGSLVDRAMSQPDDFSGGTMEFPPSPDQSAGAERWERLMNDAKLWEDDLSGGGMELAPSLDESAYMSPYHAYVPRPPPPHRREDLMNQARIYDGDLGDDEPESVAQDSAGSDARWQQLMHDARNYDEDAGLTGFELAGSPGCSPVCPGVQKQR